MPNPPPNFPLDKADRCVKCGLCLPHCPTYELSRNEAESPRGRIMLMQGLAMNLLEANTALESHLDGCLGCRACETVCPAQVPYGELIDAGRAVLQETRPQRNAALRHYAGWLTGKRRRRLLVTLLWLYQRCGLERLARGLLGSKSRPGRLATLLPRVSLPPLASYYAPPAPARGHVQLFTGCVSELADGQTLKDSIYVLNRCGYSVEIPAEQGCCGALHLHNGLTAEARDLFARNQAAFGPAKSAILGTATGCTAMLHEYGLYSDTPGADAFANRVSEISSFLHQQWPEQLQFRGIKARALLHEPCTQRNVLGGYQSVIALLQRIPGLELQPLPGNHACCGAAGSMMLTDPVQADQLLAKKLDTDELPGTDYLLSSNIGCAMHLAGGLRRRGLGVEVLHPVSLLARLLRN